ncbi:tethering factor Uso1 [Schizosaccharomyces cryophilus OY26]|uniref:Tethering factor Uso1 n=1 Tax=Schizosaccharomyces cryophilus (strain OY26 / ATCC MYA-4695 / CBS 11777 / NBRC 106824 / NRRL Y48691) TaxID=653667 RepID=S9VWC6_SCHCR|nr:tethering factor Uso1 [Schizosaccharomyces cryophilus OY26]EPY51933.1 tethering factor Uso1 [Schizosaccharomyces cryophilus OY26]
MDILQKGYNVIVAPPKVQQADEAISTLCDRLEHATLFEDRKAAALGIKSFAREFKELVAAHGLKGIIRSLHRDSSDPELLRVALETCLILTKSSDEKTSSDTALWVSDQFILNHENIQCLLNSVQHDDFYVQLYSIELFSSILACRPAELKDCIQSFPSAISTVMTPLRDTSEPIRNAALYFLKDLTMNCASLQKLVVFENAFESILSILDDENGVEGGLISADALVFLDTLLNDNITNQHFFRESNQIPNIIRLLRPDSFIDANWDSLRTRCVNLVLHVLQSLTPIGLSSGKANQNAVMKSNSFDFLLRLATNPDLLHLDVPKVAWITLAHLVYANNACQDAFVKSSYFINQNTDALSCLLNQIFLPSISPSHRYSVAFFLRALVDSNNHLAETFLQRIIDAYRNKESSKLNLLDQYLDISILADTEQYGHWLISVILSYLVAGSDERKLQLCKIPLYQEIAADEEDGEEVTFIQCISTKLIATLRHDHALHNCVGYLTLLIILVDSNAHCVKDFLSESSILQTLLTTLMDESSSASSIIQGMIAVLLALVYHYCPLDSSVPKSSIYGAINSAVTRDVFLNRLHRLHQLDQIRSHLPLNEIPDGNFNTLLFDTLFVDFFKDNFYRLIHSIDDASDAYNASDDGINTLRAYEEAQQKLITLSDELKETKSLLSSISSDKEEELRSCRNEMEEKQKLINEFQVLNDDYRQELSSLRQSLYDIKIELDYSKSNTNSMEEEMKVLREGHDMEIKDFTEENEKLRKLLDSTKDQFKVISMKNKDLHTTMQGLEKANNEFQTLKSENSSLQQKVNDLTEKIEGLNKTTISMKSSLNESKNLEESLTQQIQKKDNLLSKYKDEENGYKGQIKEFESQVSSLRNELEVLRESKGSLMDEIKTTQNVVKHQSNELKLAKQKYTSSQEKLNANSQNSKTNEKKLSSLESELREEKDAVKRLQEELDNINSEKHRLQKEVNEGDSFRTASQAAQNEQRKELEKLKSDLDELQITRETAGEENEKLKEMCEELKKKVAGLETKDDQNTAELQKQNAELEKRLKEADEYWLLIIEELETKRSRDKKALKELGHEVSEDENESDEE